MEKSNQPLSAEDILSDEALMGKLVDTNWKDEALPQEELTLSRDIFGVVNADRRILDQEGKQFLEQRIVQSIRESKRKKNFLWMGTASILLVLVGLTVIFQLQNQSIRDYAMSHPTSLTSQQTRLILSGNQEIQIDTKESSIEYSATGNQVKIDVQRNIEQPRAGEGNSFHTVMVPYGKRSQITLSDQSKVWLNSGSKLIYPARFGEEKREVFLEGEAIFEVSHDEHHPFFVLTRNLDIKVLGTLFNLSAYPDDKTVSTVLEKGSVELICPGTFLSKNKKERMLPGMMAVFDLMDQSIHQAKVNPGDYTSWKDGYVVLHKSTLGSIVKKLSRYYNTTIEFDHPELAAETFSGYLDLRSSAVQVLAIIGEIVDMEVSQVNSTIQISKKQQSRPSDVKMP